MEQVAQLARENKFDYLLIESTGISEPLPVAQTFAFKDKLGQSLSSLARLDTMVTVVDCYNFMNDFKTSETLKDRNMGVQEDDEREIVNLLIDQVM